jgi:ariadne-1
MTCVCKHDWCWLCGGAWSQHGSATGGFYACNRCARWSWLAAASLVADSFSLRHTDNAQERAPSSGDVRRVEAEKVSLAFFLHHYERYHFHAAAQRKAAADLAALRPGGLLCLDRLCAAQAVPPSQLSFAPESYELLLRCRRVLKLTYAYAFVRGRGGGGSSALFQYVQGESEFRLNELSLALDGDTAGRPGLLHFVRAPRPEAQFTAFRDTVVRLSGVTAHFFERLVASIEAAEAGGGCRGVQPAAMAPAAPAPAPALTDAVGETAQAEPAVEPAAAVAQRPPARRGFWTRFTCGRLAGRQIDT